MTAEMWAARLTRDCGVRPGGHVLAAVSGGADSVALLGMLCQAREALGLRVSCAHVEHGIRAEASREDMRFVQGLCQKLGVAFYGRRVDVPAYASAHALGIEDAARTLRRKALQEIAADCGAEWIALGHHALDQAETVLMHAARGSDIRGLCAMRWQSGRVIRPLLDQTPQALRAWLNENGQAWREDETNQDTHYARNRIRHEVIPALSSAYPGVVTALCRLAEAAQRDEAYFDALLAQNPVHVRPLIGGAALKRDELSALDDALLSRRLNGLLGDWGFGVQEAGVIRRMMQAIHSDDEAVINLSEGAHAYVLRENVCLMGAQRAAEDTPLALSGETLTPFGRFHVRQALPGETGDGVTSQAIDEAQLRGALVTGRRQGDLMIPFGRHTPVRLKKLMIDAGIERPIRDSLPVIRSGEHILWVAGLRPGALCDSNGGRRLLVTYAEGIARETICK